MTNRIEQIIALGFNKRGSVGECNSQFLQSFRYALTQDERNGAFIMVTFILAFQR